MGNEKQTPSQVVKHVQVSGPVDRQEAVVKEDEMVCVRQYSDGTVRTDLKGPRSGKAD